MLVDGKQGFPVDLPKAARAAKAGCDEAKARRNHLGRKACRHYADRLVAGEGVARDESAAARLYVETCDDAPPFGCDEAASALLDGKDIARDEARGLEMLNIGCRKKDKASCDRLEALGHDVKAVRRAGQADQALDDVFFCDNNGVAAHCANAGYRYAKRLRGRSSSTSACLPSPSPSPLPAPRPSSSTSTSLLERRSTRDALSTRAVAAWDDGENAVRSGRATI